MRWVLWGRAARLSTVVCLFLSISHGLLGADGLPARVDGLNGAPVLTSFSSSSNVGGSVTVTGTVTDENPEGGYIQFGGVLDGRFATVNADGTFAESFEVDPYSVGPASAQAVDEVGQVSNVLWDEIR